MALRGNLRDFSLPDVFQLVQLSRKTGVLRIRNADAEGSIWFRDGDVFFAQSNWHNEPLGQRMVSAQKITPSALARALELQRAEPAEGRRLGQILIDEGYITDKVLEAFVQEQIQDTIFDLMRWDNGDFDFELLPDVVHEDIGLSVSIENIVMEGSRRLEEWNRIKKKVPSMDMVFKMATAPGEGTFEISLKPTEWNLLLLVDGTRSVAELARSTNRTDFEVARIVYGLFSAGLLEVASDEEVERLRAERAEQEERMAAMRLESEMAERSRMEAEAAASAEAAVVVPVEEEEQAPTVEPPAPMPEAETTTQAAQEVPEFLSAPATAPSADDIAAFEEMMSAVLVPGAEPAGATEEQAEEAPEVVEEPQAEVEPEPVEEPQAVAEPEVAEALQAEATPVVLDEPQIEAMLEVVEERQIEAQPEVSVAEQPLAEQEAAATSAMQPETEMQPEATLPPESESGEASEFDIGYDAGYEFGALTPDDLSSIPAPPVAEDLILESELTEQGVPAVEEVTTHISTGDLEADLRALGLGELPPEITPEAGQEMAPEVPLEPIQEETPGPELALEPLEELETAVAESHGAPESLVVDGSEVVEESPEGPQLPVEVEPVVEVEPSPDTATDTEAFTWQEAGVEPDEAISQGAESKIEGLSEVLDAIHEESTAEIEVPAPPTQAPEAESDTGGASDDLDELLRSLSIEDEDGAEREAPSGVISTDAYLAEFDSNVGLSSGLGDEITALTGVVSGGGRSRPSATVNKLPEPGSGSVLHRDSAVDKELVMKIIEGIESL